MTRVKSPWIAAVLKRPFGVSVLAGAALLASAASLLYSIVAPFLVLKGFSNGLYTRSSIALLLIFCFLSLAWISGVAGVDLWKMRKRGRSLTVVSMCIFCVLGVALAATEPRGIVFWTGFPVCALSISAVVYLFSPNIRRKFEADTAVGSLDASAPRWTTVVALASLASFACIIGGFLVGFSGSFDLVPGMLIIAPFWLPYLFIPFRLRGKKIKSGLTLAMAMGVALFLPGIALIYYVHEWEKSWWIQGVFVVALLMQPLLIVAAIRAYKSLRSEPSDRWKLAVSGVYGLLLFGLFWFTAIYGNFPSPMAYNESQAMESMRGAYMAADVFAKDHDGGFPENAAAWGLDAKAECRAYHDVTLASHEIENGYVFDYHGELLSKGSHGCEVAQRYEVTARPTVFGKTGRRSFLVDQTHVIRFTSENRSATASDPEIPAGSLLPLL